MRGKNFPTGNLEGVLVSPSRTSGEGSAGGELEKPTAGCGKREGTELVSPRHRLLVESHFPVWLIGFLKTYSQNPNKGLRMTYRTRMKVVFH